jgi:hypothetical protein
MYRIFWSENLKGRDHSEDIDVDGKIILEWIFGKVGWEVEERMLLFRDRDQWWAVVNTVINLWLP